MAALAVPISMPLPPLLPLPLPHRLLNHSLIRRLLSLLNLQQRIRHDLDHRIARIMHNRRKRSSSRTNPNPGPLLQLLTLIILQQNPINAALPQQIPLHFLGDMARRTRRLLVHPVDAAVLARPARALLQALQFLDLALLVALAAQLVDFFALVQGAFFFGPDALLVSEEGGVP